MNIQLVGTAKCKETQKAGRWLKDRGWEYHFLDISKKPLSPGELDNIAQGVGGYEVLIDKEGKTFLDAGLKYMDYDPRTELLEKPALLKTPVLRWGKKSILGFQSDRYKEITP